MKVFLYVLKFFYESLSISSESITLRYESLSIRYENRALVALTNIFYTDRSFCSTLAHKFSRPILAHIFLLIILS